MALAETVSWRLHATLAQSVANGPGTRFVVWVQGCSLACTGCFNPETHLSGGRSRPVDEVLAEVQATPGIDGVTVTGGEPLEQPAALSAFLRGIRQRTELGVLVFTGYSRHEIEADAVRAQAVAAADTVVAGRYNRRLHLGTGLRGSANKEYWFLTERYSVSDLERVPDIELIIDREGSVTVTGMQAWNGTA